MKVLSLFDGISCGMVALERAEIPVERYVAYEIDEDAIKVSQHNYPMIEQQGDVFKADFSQYEGFDLLIGGSPCTYWSVAKAGGGELSGTKRETKASGLGWDLFSQYVRALKSVKPKYFLYENNFSMSSEIMKCISEELGCQPIYIDSADFSAQHRQRLYWTNIYVAAYQKNPILFEDIMQKDVKHKTRDFSKWKHTIKVSKDGLSVRYDTSGKGQYGQGNRAKKPNQKWNTLPSAGSNTKNDIWIDECLAWHLTPIEMERLQTLPDGYTSCLNSDIKSMRVCGNGWTVDVIAHIFTGINAEKEKKQMELKMNDYQLPEKISFNFEELKAELTEKVSLYETMVYTDDQIQEAKKDKANMNKLKKALNDERIRREKEYMIPFNAFKSQVNEIISIIDKPVAVIDKRVKEFEEQKKQDKLDEITNFFNSTDHPEWLHMSQIFDEKWLNASVSMKSVQDAIDARLDQIELDLTTLHDLPEFGFEATEVYKTTLDLNKAIAEGHRLSEIAKKKAEAEKAREEAQRIAEEKMSESVQNLAEAAKKTGEAICEGVIETVERMKETPAKQWISFSALLTVEQALELKNFFNSRQIQFKAV